MPRAAGIAARFGWRFAATRVKAKMAGRCAAFGCQAFAADIGVTISEHIWGRSLRFRPSATSATSVSRKITELTFCFPAPIYTQQLMPTLRLADIELPLTPAGFTLLIWRCFIIAMAAQHR